MSVKKHLGCATEYALDENKELNSRKGKLALWRKQGIAFPNDFRRDAISNQLHKKYSSKTKKELESLNIIVRIAGRMMTRRIMGKASFATLKDMGGTIQLYITCTELDAYIYNEKFKKWDLGDILGAQGKLFKTCTGELSVCCTEIHLLTKSIRPLPNKFHGLTDQETCYRQRYLDLIANEQSSHIFKIRSSMIAELRNFMKDHDFIEVETPMMHPIPGGAASRPFITHHNTLDTDLYLRIAPELYLKRLVIGGFERVFEINRNFRNEGLSPRHNPEFTMMELYMAYADYKDLMVLVETLLRTLTQIVLGSAVVKYGNHTFDFNKPFMKMTMKEAICEYLPIHTTISDIDHINTATDLAISLGIKINKNYSLGKVQSCIFEKIISDKLIQPTFITSYPVEISLLARSNDIDPLFAERFELFIGGYEIGNGFSELNDAEEQAARFAEQITCNKDAKHEAILYDKDYITALEYGLPPTAGLGIGIDRLMMLCTNSYTIRDVILFPTMRPV